MSVIPSVITKQSDLSDALAIIAKGASFAIDTEFMREKTYYPQLCLIQIAGNGIVFAIDPLVDDLDLHGLWDLLDNPDITKVFHAGRQDVEIFYHLTGRIPRTIFDSQIAAMVCGLGDQVGYDKLVKHFLNKQIDKSSRFTDWSKRPLSNKQIAYALDDVIHLEKIYPMLLSALEKDNKLDWITGEVTKLTALDTYQIDPETIYKRIKIKTNKPHTLNRLKYLAAFRERECQKRDLPRNRFIKDETLMDLAATGPTSLEALSKIRGLGNQKQGWLANQLLDVIKKADASDKASWPVIAPTTRKERPPVAVLELLRVLLKHVSDQSGIAPRLIASAADLEELALSDDKNQPVLQGWRGEVFGQKALDLKSGKMALSLSNNHLRFFDI
ncbi:MAG: ribonuclease D [Candidatus Puniceispirillaceae bacterium]